MKGPPPTDSARDRILGRLRTSIERRATMDRPVTMDRPASLDRPASTDRRASQGEHPGPFLGERPAVEGDATGEGTALDHFRTMFQLSGGEVVELPDEAAARSWIQQLDGPASVCLGTGAPDLLSALPKVEPHLADLAISRARAAIGETGSIVLDSRDGRRTQLLAPTHVVLVEGRNVHLTLAGALTAVASDLPSALGLHSGPSKSADIGQVMVRGVHGPGRVIAVVLTG